MCEALDRIEEKGKMQVRTETTLKMIKANFEVKQIAELTGLSVSKVTELKNGVSA